MTTAISITQSNLFTALRTFLLSILPAGIEVVMAETNRVAEPEGSDFVVMTPLLRERQSTNVDTYADGYPSLPGVMNSLQSTKVTVQLDVHGPNSPDNAQIISTLFRDEYAVDNVATSGYDVAPLYCGDPRQVPFLNAEQQIEVRWSMDAVMQANPVVTVSQQFAAALDVVPESIDAFFHP